jgi:hypothetical protein
VVTCQADRTAMSMGWSADVACGAAHVALCQAKANVTALGSFSAPAGDAENRVAQFIHAAPVRQKRVL